MSNYQEILKSVGWPEQVLVLDFETYFDQEYSLSKMSTIEYIQDPKFDFLGCGLYCSHQLFPEGPLVGTCFIVPDEISYYLSSMPWDDITVVAKNCKFDMTILAVKFGIIPPFIIDVDDLLRHYDARMSHRMKDVTSMFRLQSKGDTNQFKGLHYEDMDLKTRHALEKYCVGDIDIEVDLFKILLPKITNPTIEIPIARHTLDLYLKPKFKFDFKKAGGLRAKMLVKLDQIIDATGFTKKQLSSNLEFVKILQDALPESEIIPVKPGKPGKNMIKLLGSPRVIPAFAKDDVGFQNLLVHSDKTVRNLCKARQAVKSWPLHTKRIDNMADQADVSGGLLRVPLHYYGGHTGRWSGGEGINLQNLGGRGRAGSGTHPLIAAMRSLLSTPDGSILGIVDSAQIEARLLAWMAGQSNLILEFICDISPYCTFATKLFQEPTHKPSEEEKLTPEGKQMAIKYGFGKDGILGLGYGMGANKFYQRCMANENLRPLFESGEYDFAFIKYAIDTYRSTYSKIPEFWKSIEKAFKWVIKYPHEETTYKIPNNSKYKDFYLTFFNDNSTVHLRLPSGRELTYRHCALKHTTKGSEIRWHWGHLWGGSITENIIQSVARDLLAWWILEMEKVGLNVIFTNHDEIVCMLSEVFVPELSLKRMLDIMCTGPDWAAGLPLNAEGCLSECYKK